MVSALVLAGLGAFVAAVYVVVVVAGAALVGRTDRPHVDLVALATVVVAVGSEPVGDWLESVVTRRIDRGRVSPYDALRRFAASALDGVRPEDVPALMARALVEGTGAAWAGVWLVVDGEPELAAAWPDGATPSAEPGVAGVRERDVVMAGERLALLRLKEGERGPLTPVEERLFTGLAEHAGPVLHGVRLRLELTRRAAELERRAEEVRASRQRCVDAQDDARRRLERDIHDGAQQHLVALAVSLRLVEAVAGRDPDRAAAVLADLGAATDDTIAALTDLARGIYPRALSEEGVGAALRSVVGAAPIAVTVDDRLSARPPAGVEAAVYFSCVEALQNAAKHSGATTIRVTLVDDAGAVEFAVADDGRGFDAGVDHEGVGMANMRDRVDSVGGRLTVVSTPGAGTIVAGSVPAGGDPQCGETAR